MQSHILTNRIMLISFAILVCFSIFGNDYTRQIKNESLPVFSKTVYSEGVTRTGKSFAGTYAQSATLISGDTGELLFQQNGDTVLPMASTTKIMTALLVLENLKLEDTFEIPKDACGVEGSSIYLTPGENITIKDLLYGLMLESGNDAATALAIATSGDTESFVALMNEKAKEMGLYSTSFTNPHGLSDENHHTTAYELAKITYNAFKNETFREICKTKNYISTSLEGKQRYFSNHNRMLRMYSGCTGVKTGYTINSGRCLVTSAQRDGATYIAVTLNDRNDWNDHERMLDYAFSNFECKKFFESSELCFRYDGIEYKNPEPVFSLFEKGTGKLEFTVLLEGE